MVETNNGDAMSFALIEMSTYNPRRINGELELLLLKLPKPSKSPPYFEKLAFIPRASFKRWPFHMLGTQKNTMWVF